VRAGRPAPLLLSCLATPRSAAKPAAVWAHLALLGGPRFRCATVRSPI
jgi:hypothetical protein